ncbi:SMP-30/gluconolactonase/LRE family protein [Streptomyces katrae]|uniref:SMP-30/gluconolactonase/LRE family protein n=1 Tax=Streptomyces katrae TaxID=68223 RepID=UPI000996135B
MATERPELYTCLDDRCFSVPNGLVFSPDERQLFVSHTRGGAIRVFDVHAAGGRLTDGEVFAKADPEGGPSATPLHHPRDRPLLGGHGGHGQPPDGPGPPPVARRLLGPPRSRCPSKPSATSLAT